jgi:hypothetical protein
LRDDFGSGQLRALARTVKDAGQARRRHCQRKIDYFACALNWQFAAIDISRFFRIDPSGSIATSSI